MSAVGGKPTMATWLIAFALGVAIGVVIGLNMVYTAEPNGRAE